MHRLCWFVFFSKWNHRGLNNIHYQIKLRKQFRNRYSQNDDYRPQNAALYVEIFRTIIWNEKQQRVFFHTKLAFLGNEMNGKKEKNAYNATWSENSNMNYLWVCAEILQCFERVPNYRPHETGTAVPLPAMWPHTTDYCSVTFPVYWPPLICHTDARPLSLWPPTTYMSLGKIDTKWKVRSVFNGWYVSEWMRTKPTC